VIGLNRNSTKVERSAVIVSGNYMARIRVIEAITHVWNAEEVLALATAAGDTTAEDSAINKLKLTQAYLIYVVALEKVISRRLSRVAEPAHLAAPGTLMVRAAERINVQTLDIDLPPTSSATSPRAAFAASPAPRLPSSRPQSAARQ
jgi:hypothetical protein